MISVRNPVKKFGNLTAVDDISFEVQQGEIFAFLGSNAAGKTTTIKMLTTLLTPTSGVMELDEINPAVQRNEACRFGISMTSDESVNHQKHEVTARKSILGSSFVIVRVLGG